MKPLRPDDPLQVGGYRLLRLLGAGGMGRVYLGRSRGGRIVAVKVVRPELADDVAFRARFRREVDAARRVGGAWTAPVVDADPDADQPWLVTGYVPGPSLFEAVDTRGPLPLPSLRVLGAGLAEALVAVHGAGLVHRDLKPSNVLLALDGPKVIDFGITHAVDATVLTRTGVVIGSPAFMPSEQIEGHGVTPASDVFSLGAVMVFAAAGVGPFGTGSLQTLMFRILTQEPDLGAVPPTLAPVVARCLAKTPAHRPTAAEVLAAIVPGGGGTASLVGDGWLPPDLADALGRRAVELLDLDDGDHGDVPPLTSVPQPWAGYPATAPDASAARRPLALAVAAVVLAVLAVGAVAAALALRGGDDTDRFASGLPSSSVPPSSSVSASVSTSPSLPSQMPTTSGAPPPVAGPLPSGGGPLPAEYVGRWEGTITSQNLGLEQHVVMTMRAGGNGDVVADVSFAVVGVGDVVCRGSARLVGVDDTGVQLADVPGSGDNPTLGGLEICTSGGSYLLRRLPDDELAFRLIEQAAGGNPTGTLRRTA